jgi:ribosomal protein L11 methyltransferase
VKTKPLWKLSVVTSPEAEDAVSELLERSLSEPSASYTDVETGEVTVTSYLSSKIKWTSLRAVIVLELARIKSCGLNLGQGKVSFRKVRREDWAESWKRHFKPIEVGSALVVKQSWSKRSAKPNQAVVILDPGLSFGTGQHPTTSFCLQQLVSCRFGPKFSGNRSTPSRKADAMPEAKPSFLDIGTGSGILAIAAAKIGYQSIEAFDFDPEAVRVAGDNARKNRVAHKLRLYQADLTKLPRCKSTRFDVICANLISTLLIAERDRILSRLKPDGVLIIAGILAGEFAEVQSVYEIAGWKLIVARTENEWCSGRLSKGTNTD